MKKLILMLTVMVMVAFVAVSFAASKSKMDLKVGDEIYACNCGDSCPCKTMARKAGNCSCDKEMVKAKVMSIDGDKVMLKADSWEKERAFKATGKYICGCGEGCNCDTISQNPGKCGCGAKLKKVQ
ncbi:MAG: hypothetical protein HZB31_04870 [Nitrospirae bacterium]|nr:hypothetical protein [Nitrospirota bacterium]